jgi:hypothetical protein
MEEGKRFSQVYLERGAPIRESVRFRNRLSAYFSRYLGNNHTVRVASVIEAETGTKIPRIGTYYDIPTFFERNELRDIFDSITLIYQVLNAAGYKTDAETWKSFVTRVIEEENLGYRLDPKCGVHYFVDEEFERNRISTLLALDDPKYSGVRDAYEAAYRHMDSDPPDSKAAVRSMFGFFRDLNERELKEGQ